LRSARIDFPRVNSRDQIQDLKFPARLTEQKRELPKPLGISQANEAIIKRQRPVLALTYETGLGNAGLRSCSLVPIALELEEFDRPGSKFPGNEDEGCQENRRRAIGTQTNAGEWAVCPRCSDRASELRRLRQPSAANWFTVAAV